MSKNQDSDDQWGLVIPIGVLFVIYMITGVGWVFFPILILLCVLCGNVREDALIRRREEEIDYWKAPERGTYTSGYMPEGTPYGAKPIYDRRKQKQQGTDFGLLIPIFILGAVWLFTGVVWMAIPILVLIILFFSSFSSRSKASAQVRDYMHKKDIESVQDIADKTGMSEERVRRYIVDQKRSGESAIWFDPSTGTKVPSPVKETPAEKTIRACPYCGFALKEADRFCPFCGAPIRA
ncbi:MAG: zinc-ribbon domain-containing protein [Promethearchaeota archaeon]